MATVESWFWEFVPKLKDRVRRGDWPSADAEYWETMYRSLARAGCNATVADEAAQLLAEQPPEFLGQVLPAFLGYVRQVFKSSEVAAHSETGSRDAARMEAREWDGSLGCFVDCPDCSGEGIAVRYRRESRKPGTSGAVCFWCRCPLGRWMEAHFRSGSEAEREVHRRMPDLADHPRLWGDEYRQRPEFIPAPGSTTSAAARRQLASVGPVPNSARGPDGRIYQFDGDTPPWAGKEVATAVEDDGPAF